MKLRHLENIKCNFLFEQKKETPNANAESLPFAVRDYMLLRKKLGYWSLFPCYCSLSLDIASSVSRDALIWLEHAREDFEVQ